MLSINVSEMVDGLIDRWENHVNNMSGFEIIMNIVFWVMIALVIDVIYHIYVWTQMADTESSVASSHIRDNI